MWRPTWAEVDLGALRRNLRRLNKTARVPLLFVVKADAYGHGAARAARAALEVDAVAALGVSSVEEGAALREAGIKAPILILGSLYPFESTLAAIHYGLTPTVASLEGARRIQLAAAGLRGADRRLLPLSCHLKIDTGMGRVGVRWPAGREVVQSLLASPGVRLEGLYTHLARAEDSPSFTKRQLAVFARAVRESESLGARFKWRHAANSAGALLWPESRWDLVRPGLAAYGLWEGFEPVLSLKTRVVFVKNVPRGTPLGYGGLFRTRRASRIATLPIGYADGLPRVLSTGRRRAEVLVRGRRCALAGAISMDMAMADVTGVPGVSVGDEAVLIGRSGSEEQGAGALAALAGTIPYEIVTGLTSRVPRLYRE
ncbi:MAG: alanine racemase [Elusimicrobia bacterium]|nr:alanine racemase [Elusimicrobiota bacterium]